MIFYNFIKIVGCLIILYVLIVLISKTFKKSNFVMNVKALVFLFVIGLYFINIDKITKFNFLWGMLEAQLQESNNALREISRLRNEYKLQLQELQKITRYNNIALLGPEGCAGQFCRSEGLFQIMQNTIESQGNQKSFKCDNFSRKQYVKAIEEYPDFPFAYYAEANCLRDLNDPKYKDFANKASDIFKYTIQVPGHNRLHKSLLDNLKAWGRDTNETFPNK